MKTISKSIIIIILIFLIVRCGDDNTEPNNIVCDENFIADSFTNGFPSPNYDREETLDTRVHEYTMEILSDGKICSVGYQNSSNHIGAYDMTIKNITTGDIYTGSHTFSQTQLEFQSITPVIVHSGDVILVKRRFAGGYTLFNEIIGYVYRKPDYTNLSFPITVGNVKFLSSNFYEDGGPVPNNALPIIPLGFIPN